MPAKVIPPQKGQTNLFSFFKKAPAVSPADVENGKESSEIAFSNKSAVESQIVSKETKKQTDKNINNNFNNNDISPRKRKSSEDKDKHNSANAETVKSTRILNDKRKRNIIYDEEDEWDENNDELSLEEDESDAFVANSEVIIHKRMCVNLINKQHVNLYI